MPRSVVMSGEEFSCRETYVDSTKATVGVVPDEILSPPLEGEISGIRYWRDVDKDNGYYVITSVDRSHGFRMQRKGVTVEFTRVSVDWVDVREPGETSLAE